MNIKTLASVVLLTLVVSLLTFGQGSPGYKTYRNARFGYSVEYPSKILVPQGEATNGDGQKFVSSDGRAEMIVYGSNNALEQTLAQAYDEARSPAGASQSRIVTYQVMKPDWFVVSGKDSGKIFYQKTIFRGGVFKTMRIEYDENRKVEFDPITTRVSLSFKG